MSAPQEEIRQVVEPAIRSAGLVLEDLTVRGGKHAVVRVVVDLPEDSTANIGFDQIDSVTAVLSELLDNNPEATSALPHYTLEVMSPGAERKLTAARHWKRSRGRLVAVVLSSGKNLEGRIVSADDTSVELEGSGGDSNMLRYDEISHAKVRLELDKPKTRGQRGQEPK